jgi:hypothetical protein
METGPWLRLLDVERPLEFAVQLEAGHGLSRRAAGSIQAVVERLRAQRAAATQSTLGMLSSLSASASLTDKLSSSQYSLGATFSKFPASRLSSFPVTLR